MRTPILILLFVAIFFSKANLNAQGLVAVQNYSADFKTLVASKVNDTGEGAGGRDRCLRSDDTKG